MTPATLRTRLRWASRPGPVRWIVFETGERCRVSTWPPPPPPDRSTDEPRPGASPAVRFLVFESPAGREHVRISPGLDLARLSPGELWALYRRVYPDVGCGPGDEL